MGRNNLLGAWGEGLAASYLRKKWYYVEAMNFECRFGELDLVAKRFPYIVFVEVKTRKDDSFAQAREYVNERKRDRIRASAMMYLEKHPSRLRPRFDVIEIYAPEGYHTAHPVINHLEDAFQ